MKTYPMFARLGACVSMASLLSFNAPLQADQQLTTPFSMPVHVEGVVNETGCRNHPGPTVTLEGEIRLGGLQVQLTLKNNVKGTHQTTVVFATNVVLVPVGGAITIPKQPVLGGVGGNPHIWLQFIDEDGNALSDETYLGRCVQGLSVSGDFLNEAIASTLVAVGDCSNHPGPTITLSGDLRLSGLSARFIFRNNLQGTHTAEATRDVEIIAEGSTITIPKQPLQGGVGGNPIICLQFLQGNGDPIGPQIRLGRCNKL